MTQPLLVDNLPAEGLGHHVKAYRKAGFHLPWHMHDSYELTLIQRGSGQRVVGSHIAPFSSGDLVLLGPNLPHAWKNNARESSGSVRAITLKLAPDNPLLRLAQLPSMQPLKAILDASERGLLVTGAARTSIAEKMVQLVELPQHRQPAAILAILTELSDSPDTRTLLPGPLPNYSARESAATRGVIEHIFEHYDQPLKAGALALVAGMHPSSLGRMFKRTTGFTPSEFINQVRINHASQLLQDTDLPVLEVSLRCGYDNLSWFNRVFRRHHGCTPREFRQHLV